MIKRLKLPKVQMSFALIAIYLSAFGQLPLEQYLYVLIFSTVSCLFFDLLISYIRIRKLFIPHAAMVTGMILTLLIDPTLAWYKIAGVAFIAMAVKNFVRVSNKHIFNPVVSGLFLGGLIFNQNVAWWGTSFQYSSTLNIQTIILYIILLSPLYISTIRIRRHFTIISFLLTNLFLTIFSTGDTSSSVFLDTLLNSSILFFAIVMLPEPITSPAERNRQVLYGATVGVLSFMLGLNFVSGTIFLPDVLITSLLISNLIFFKR